MNRFYNYFLALLVAVATMTAFTGCETSDLDDGDGTTPPVTEEGTPTVASVVVDETTITTSSVSIEVTYSDIIELNYTYYVVDDKDNTVCESSIEVDAESTSYTIELEMLKEGTEYAIDVWGTDAEEIESEMVSQTFTTTAISATLSQKFSYCCW